MSLVILQSPDVPLASVPDELFVRYSYKQNVQIGSFVNIPPIASDAMVRAVLVRLLPTLLYPVAELAKTARVDVDMEQNLPVRGALAVAYAAGQ